jgi:hypothetical protein
MILATDAPSPSRASSASLTYCSALAAGTDAATTSRRAGAAAGGGRHAWRQRARAYRTRDTCTHVSDPRGRTEHAGRSGSVLSSVSLNVHSPYMIGANGSVRGKKDCDCDCDC